MTNRELINILINLPLDDKEVLLFYPKEHIDENGNKCNGYVFPIDGVETNGFGISINFTDWRDKEANNE